MSGAPVVARMRLSRRLAGAAVLVATGLLAGGSVALAGALDALSSADAAGGVKAALSQSITSAVGKLGTPGGFLNDPKVAIPLPGGLDKAESALRMVGMSGEADELRTTMNHAAEAAVATATPVLKKALTGMSLSDAKAILTGGDTAATEYFRRTTGTDLRTQFRPIIAKQTAKLHVADAYNRLAGKAAEVGLIRREDASIDDYVADKALDGLFAMMADEERAIRKDPLGQASSLIKKAFGAL